LTRRSVRMPAGLPRAVASRPYRDAVEDIRAFIAGAPVRVLTSS
jgi:hypothetical protein